jgi:type I restriction enzyme R subunit
MITEDHLEQLALTWFQDSGWEYVYGPDIAPDGDAPERADYRQVILPGRLLDALRRLNPTIPGAVLDEVVHRVGKLHEPSLLKSNRTFHELLLDGVAVEVETDGVKRGDRVRLMGFW